MSVAFDTNILVYTIDTREPKHRLAREVVAGHSDGSIPWQVACEFVSVTERLRRFDPAGTASWRDRPWDFLVQVLRIHPLVLPTQTTLPRARALMEAHQLQHWDALLYAACLEAGINTLISEDLPGLAIPGLEVRNPFAV
jgi:predicted nucleic acid-binding protein